MVSSHLVGEIVSAPSEFIMVDLAESMFKILGFSTSVYVHIEVNTMVGNSKWIPPSKNIHKYVLECQFSDNKKINNELRCQQDANNNLKFTRFVSVGVNLQGPIIASQPAS